MQRNNGGIFGFFNALVALIVVVGLTVAGVLFWQSRTQTAQTAKPPTVTPTPTISSAVVLQTIHSTNQLVTAERPVQEAFTDSTKNRGVGNIPVPGSDQSITYIAVYDVKAGIDLSKITAQDIVIEGDTVRITLPAPYIVSQSLDSQKSYVASRTGGPSTGIGTPEKDLMNSVLRDADQKARDAVLADDQLLQAAQENAATSLRQLLEASGVKNIVFVRAPLPTRPAATTSQTVRGTVAASPTATARR